jgi:hypothetical protein
VRTPIPSGPQPRCAPSRRESRAGLPASDPAERSRIGSGLTPPPVRPVGCYDEPDPGWEGDADGKGLEPSPSVCPRTITSKPRLAETAIRRVVRTGPGAVKRKPTRQAGGASGSLETGSREASCIGPNVMMPVFEPLPRRTDVQLRPSQREPERREATQTAETPLAGRRHPAHR